MDLGLTVILLSVDCLEEDWVLNTFRPTRRVEGEQRIRLASASQLTGS